MSEGARQVLEPTRWRIPSAPVIVMMVATLGGSVGLVWSQRSMMSAGEPAALAELPLAGETRQEPIIAAGTIRWGFTDAGALGPQVVGDLAVPERQLSIRVSVWKNTDDELPASHIIEMVAEPARFPGRSIATVTAVFMKPAPDRNGQPLTGAAVTVAGNRFWIALSSDPGALPANLDRLFGGEVFEFSMTYDTGRRAALAFEKGATGRDAFERARVAWGDGSTGF